MGTCADSTLQTSTLWSCPYLTSSSHLSSIRDHSVLSPPIPMSRCDRRDSKCDWRKDAAVGPVPLGKPKQKEPRRHVRPQSAPLHRTVTRTRVMPVTMGPTKTSVPKAQHNRQGHARVGEHGSGFYMDSPRVD